jgi:hypothetical protein
MRLYKYAVLLVILLTGAIAACGLKSIDTDTDDGGPVDQNDPYQIDQTVVWGGQYNKRFGVHFSDLQNAKTSTHFEADMISLDIAAGGESFLLTQVDGTTLFLSKDGQQYQTDAVAPAFLCPNARRVIFEAQGNIWETAVAGTGPMLIAEAAKRASYDNAMNHIAWSTEEGLFIHSTQSDITRHIVLSFAIQFDIEDDDPGLQPVFSPDGLLVAAPMVVWGNGEKGIRTFIIELDKDLEVTWIGGARYPTWSADSRKLAYDSDSRIYIWDLDSDSPNRQVVFSQSTQPRFSADDNFLLFVERDLDEGNLSVADLNIDIAFPAVEYTNAPIIGHDWLRDPYCGVGNSAPSILKVEVVVDGESDPDPIEIQAEDEVAVRLTIEDPDCNMAHGIAFAVSGEEHRAIQFDFSDAACGSFVEQITLAHEYQGLVELAFSVEDDCGAGGVSETRTFYFHAEAADDDVKDETYDDNSANSPGPG